MRNPIDKALKRGYVPLPLVGTSPPGRASPLLALDTGSVSWPSPGGGRGHTRMTYGVSILHVRTNPLVARRRARPSRAATVGDASSASQPGIVEQARVAQSGSDPSVPQTRGLIETEQSPTDWPDFSKVAARATTVALLVLRPAGSKEGPWPPLRPTATILIVREEGQ